MSQEWVDLVRLGFEAAQRGEMAAFDGMTTPDLVLVQPPEVPDAKTYEGRGAVAEAMEDWPNQWEDFRMLRSMRAAASDTPFAIAPFAGKRTREPSFGRALFFWNTLATASARGVRDAEPPRPSCPQFYPTGAT
jgi:ketosteroid isomerase-like protein